ncbi:hypothetical protein CRENBAI_011146 [Crenichthys baileyi]|uniref:Uncharacterized protein n=1 Tax=Crenichthys baileyi TaxID=28760 RepID=A0AAV9S1P3_9TELE
MKFFRQRQTAGRVQRQHPCQRAHLQDELFKEGKSPGFSVVGGCEWGEEGGRVLPRRSGERRNQEAATREDHRVSHDFAINFNPEDDECEGMSSKPLEDILGITLIFSSLHRFSIGFKLGI